jgi:hypothetical protein
VIKKLKRTVKIQEKKILSDQMANNLDLVLVLDRQELLLPVLAMAHLVAEVRQLDQVETTRMGATTMMKTILTVIVWMQMTTMMNRIKKKAMKRKSLTTKLSILIRLHRLLKVPELSATSWMMERKTTKLAWIKMALLFLLLSNKVTG